MGKTVESHPPRQNFHLAFNQPMGTLGKSRNLYRWFSGPVSGQIALPSTFETWAKSNTLLSRFCQ